ncbi:hypothetical protein SAMN04489709_13057 [Paracidovorax citrulli]|nr:hypothetical protein SAMN04489709_13057 [Paracidovorax citrulli]
MRINGKFLCNELPMNIGSMRYGRNAISPGFFHSLKMQASAWALTEDKPLMHLAGRTAYRQPRISTHCTVPHTATKAA